MIKGMPFSKPMMNMVAALGMLGQDVPGAEIEDKDHRPSRHKSTPANAKALAKARVRAPTNTGTVLLEELMIGQTLR